MENTDEYFKKFTEITGIVPEWKGDMVNVTKMLEDYRKLNPKEFEKRFKNMTNDEIILQFLKERMG